MSNKMRKAGEVSVWGRDAAARYDAAKHGPDGAKFLDLHLYRLMEEARGKAFLDLGAGTGPWSKHALNIGATTVTSLDLNEAMLAQARARLAVSNELPEAVSLIRANVNQLPFPARNFNFLASINVGCNLPSGTFEDHFKEALRVAKKGATFVVTAPDSLFVSFTSTEDTGDIQAEIDRRWEETREQTAQAAKEIVGNFRNVLRATFVLDEKGKPILVTKENSGLVSEGMPIIRRIPGLAVDNNFHTAKSYVEAAKKAGWQVEELIHQSFTSEAERMAYNESAEEASRLGPEYVGNPPFLVMKLKAA